MFNSGCLSNPNLLLEDSWIATGLKRLENLGSDIYVVGQMNSQAGQAHKQTTAQKFLSWTHLYLGYC